MPSATYQLLDHGDGRKLEQFGPLVLDRPCPAAMGIDAAWPERWSFPDVLRIDSSRPPPLDPWQISLIVDPASDVRLSFQMKLTPFGHVGLFPEQQSHWSWLYQRVQKHAQSIASAFDSSSEAEGQEPCFQALNLFAYTGGSTLALSLAGASVVHVDASEPAVAWARENARLNCLQDRPIRWIVEDARKFISREIRRGNQYDLIVLDPPSYGHGPTGKPWSLEQEWEMLLAKCLQLVRPGLHSGLLWTGHSDQPSPGQITSLLNSHGWQSQWGRSNLTDSNGRKLDAGYYIRAASSAPTVNA